MISSIFRKISLAITIAMIGIFLISIIGIGLFKVRPYIIVSGSMEPKIKVGSIVLIDTKYKEVDVGDVIAYSLSGITVTHRVVEKEEKGYVTRGDANDANDPKAVTEAQVIGKVIGSIPRLGYIASFVKTPYGIGFILGIVILIEILCNLINRKARDKK